MMIAESKSPVVMTSKNGGRKYFMPNRPLATPDYSSDSLCSVEKDDSDRSSSNDNNRISVNVSNGSTNRKNREHEVHDAHIEEEEQNGVIMSDEDDDHNHKIENRESSNTCNYSYSYSSSSSSSSSRSESSNIINNTDDDHDGENDVVVSNSVISSYQTSPLSFMSSFARTNENSTTSTKKAVMVRTNLTPLAIGNEQETVNTISKLKDSNKNHEVTDEENDNNDSQDNKHEYWSSSESSNNNNDKNDHIHMDEEEDEKQLERKINDSKDNDHKEFASNKQNNEPTNNRFKHEHEELDNIDDMENVITSLELPETENNCESIREVFVHSGQDAPIKLHVNHPPLERQPLYTHDDYMYSKPQQELEEEYHHQEEQETEEKTPPRLEKRKLSYKDKGHVEPLSPEQLIEPRHFTPMNVDKELHKQLQTKEDYKRPEQKEHEKELEKIDRHSNSNSSSSSRSKEETNSSTTFTSSVYSSDSSIHNNNINDDDENNNLKEMPSPYASSSSSVVHSESTSPESSHASSSQQVVTPVQAKELLETALSEREQGNKEQERQNRNVVSSSSSTSSSSSSSSSASSSSSPLKVKKKKRVESITNVPDSRLVHTDQETNSNDTNENCHLTGTNDNSGVSYDKVSSDHKPDDERKVCVDAHNNEGKTNEETDNVISKISAKVDKINSEEYLNAKHLQEQKQLEKQMEEIQVQKSSTARIADKKQRSSVKENEIVSQVNIVNKTKMDEKKSARLTDKNSNDEKADVKTSEQSTKTSKSESRIHIEPLRTNSHTANKNMSKNVTGIANNNETAVANTKNSSNYKVESSKDHHDSKPNNNTKEEQNKEVLPSITRKSSKLGIAHSNNITTTTVKQNSHIQAKAKANAVTTASRVAEQPKNATKDINTHEISIKEINNESMNTKHEHKNVSKAHVDHVHVERLGKLVSPEHNFTQVRQENSLREQRVNRLYELLDKPDAHHNSKRSNGKIKSMQHSHQQQQKQEQRNQRLEREMQSNNVSRNWKNKPHAQGCAIHMMRQEKRRHDHLSEEHLPTIVTEESGEQTMSIFLEPVADDMIDSKTYYFSVRAIPESGSMQNADNSHYYNNHHNVSTLPNLSLNRSQHLHPENPIINIVNHQDSNYLTRQTGNKGHVLSPLSRQRFRPYNITNARATVLPPVQTNKLYRPTNTKEQNRKKRKQRRLEANKPRLRRPLGLLDIPVLEITKYGPDPYAHVLRYNGF